MTAALVIVCVFPLLLLSWSLARLAARIDAAQFSAESGRHREE